MNLKLIFAEEVKKLLADEHHIQSVDTHIDDAITVVNENNVVILLAFFYDDEVYICHISHPDPIGVQMPQLRVNYNYNSPQTTPEFIAKFISDRIAATEPYEKVLEAALA